MSFRFGLVLLLVAAAFGADTGDWNAVKGLKKGDRVGVVQSDMKRVEGRFESATDDAITVISEQTVTLAKDRVVRVYRRPLFNRGVRTILGAGIGAAVGGVVDASFGKFYRNETNEPPAGAITAIGAAAGAGIGAATGGGYHTVYQRK